MITKRIIAGIALFVFTSTASLTASFAANEVLVPKRTLHPDSIDYPDAGKVERPKFKSDASRRNILGLERPYPGALPTLRKGMPVEMFLETQQVDTLEVLGFRVEFQKEEPDNPLTTGNGEFDMRDTLTFMREEGHNIDITPHDANYFAAHLEALSKFWWEMSGHTLYIRGEIWPPQGEDPYRLPKTLANYHEEYGPDPRNHLGEYFREVIQMVDTLSPGVEFTMDDGRVKPIYVFHPGADQQTNLGPPFGVDTEYDFFTGFLFLFEGVTVDDGAAVVTDGIIMPETNSQDGRIQALNAVISHEFSHVLGLRDLYNTYNNFTQIGDFSIMDNNGLDVAAELGMELDGDIYTYYAFGVLPVSVDIWSKAYLGFAQTETVYNGDSLAVIASAQVKEGNKAYKIPIDGNEYYILENRQLEVDFAHEDPTIRYPDVILADKLTGVILGPGYARVEGDSLLKFYNGEYDRILDGSGMIIWHVDEYAAHLDYVGNGVGNWDNNTLQWDKDRRFIHLMEADGIIDFGGNFHAGYGTVGDMWPTGDNNELTPDTKPATVSNSGAETGVYITDISASDTTMYFDVHVNRSMDGWPMNSVRGTLFGSHPVPCDLEGDGEMEIFQATSNIITGFRYDGRGIINNIYSLSDLGIRDFDGELLDLPLRMFAYLPGYVYVGTPSIGDIDGDGAKELVIGAADSNLHAYEPVDNDGDSLNIADPVTGFPVSLGAGAATTTMLANYDSDPNTLEMYIGTDDGIIHVFDHDGTILSSLSDANKISGLFSGLALYSDSSKVFFTSNSEETDSCFVGVANITLDEIVWSKGYTGMRLYEPVIGDINRDNTGEVVVVSDYGDIMVFDEDGEEIPGWGINAGDSLGASAILADIDRNGYLEIVIPGNSKIHCYMHSGAVYPDYPAEIENRYLTENKQTGLMRAPAVIAGEMNGDGKLDMIAGSPSGNVFMPEFDYRMNSYVGTPFMAIGTPVSSAPFVADIDGDGDIEVGARGDMGFINIWDMTADFDSDYNVWQCYGRTPEHRFSVPDSLLSSVSVTGEFLPERAVYAYPNPTHGDVSYIRYRIDKAVDVDVNIMIFDVAGNRVAEYNERQTGPADFDFPWDCSDFASGVYLARVEATSSGESKHVFTKIAIVR
ncbi:MAG: hypothetical protein GF307_10220 [candidate division Zixibacteria bacterium]|nr:hypothetical protein [candidate division Zixibacteria bacterium]